MESSLRQRSEQGATHIVVVAMIVLVVAVLLIVFLNVGKKNNGAPDSSSQAAGKAASKNGSSSGQAADNKTAARVATNMKRRADAGALLAAVDTFKAQNNGALPESFRDDALRGGTSETPVPLKLDHYSGVLFGNSDSLPSIADVLILVVAAECAPGGATREGSNAAAVAQFAVQNTDDGFTPQCLAP